MSLSARLAAFAAAVGEAIKDNGWTTSNIQSGQSGTMRSRRIGNVVYIWGNVSGSFTQGSNLIGYIPAKNQPVSGNGAARFWSPGESAGIVSIISSGRVDVIVSGSGTYANVAFSVALAISP